jgi:hypothetical protein
VMVDIVKGGGRAIGCNEFDFFLDNEENRPCDGAKLKSKTHLQNIFFDFLSRFLRVWLQIIKKC